MSEHSRLLFPKTEETPAVDLQRAIDEARLPVLPQFARPTSPDRSRVSRTNKLLGAATLAFAGMVGRDAIHDHRRADTDRQGEEEITVSETGLNEDGLARAAAARRRVQYWQSYIKRLDRGERFPTTIDPEDTESARDSWRRFENVETTLLMEIGPEFREEVMHRARKSARMLILQPQTPKTAAEVTRALDQAVDMAVQGAAAIARDRGWKGLNLMRADSVAMQVISKELRTSMDGYPETQSRLFLPLFEALRERAIEKRDVERSAPDSHRADRDPVTGVTVPSALAETETLPETIFFDQFAWLGQVGGDEARLVNLRHHLSDIRTLVNNGFLPWLERSAPLIRRDPVFARQVVSVLQRMLSYDELASEQSMRVRRLVQVLHPSR